MNKGTLLIGGGGFIGAYLAPILLASGRKVTAVGRSAAPRHALPAGVRYVAADFAAVDHMRPLLESHGEVVHLAYATIPNTSYDNPLGDLLGNLPSTLQLFAEVADTGGRLLLVSSGGTVYGEAETLPITEQHPTNPISPYGVTKLTLEKYAFLYAATHNLDVVCVRPANAYGEGQRPFAGQGFVATAMASSMQGKPIRIFGDRGTVRDYVHARDIADGLFRALEGGRRGEIYNLGSGIGRSNLDVVEAIAPLMREIGAETQVIHEPERPFDVRRNVLDSSRLAAHAGWKPSVDFAEGLRLTREWLRSGIV